MSKKPTSTTHPSPTLLALKADGGVPPIWYRDAVQLRYLLQGAWNEVSADFVEQFIAALRTGDLSKVEELLQEAEKLGVDMVSALGTNPEAVLSNMLLKADSFWHLHAVDVGIKRPAKLLERYRERAAVTQANQIKEFCKKNPTRILHPEVARQLEHLRDTDTPDLVTITTVADRLQDFVKQEQYWDQLTDVQVGRVWHARGILYAQRNEVRTGRITGPLDALTCPVCRHLLGLPIEIERAVDKIRRDLYLQDPDEYVAAWRFPRLADVDNMSRDELQAKGPWIPPFHPHCRHSVAWLYIGHATNRAA